MSAIKAPIHGGDLVQAMQQALNLGYDAGEKSDWLDLSTGINPNPYPVRLTDLNDFHCLPSAQIMEKLLLAATDYYHAPNEAAIVAAPGTAILIQMIPLLFKNMPVTIVAPTYGDHERAWQRAGFSVNHALRLEEARPENIVVLVNPNNPDGRSYGLQAMQKFSRKQKEVGGYLIVDEAFGDVSDARSASELIQDYRVLVLKSVGKFFGLAGLRLGFALGEPEVVTRLHDQLGSWAVSGPAIRLGTEALADQAWQAMTRASLTNTAHRLNQILKNHGLSVKGGTDLFVLVEDERAGDLYNHLLKHRIYVRCFDYNENWLRIGLPKDEQAFARLDKALASR